MRGRDEGEQMSKSDIHDTLKLSSAELDTLLAKMNASGGASKQHPKRGMWRWRLQSQRIVVTCVDETGKQTHLVAAARNISATGVGLLIGFFIHEGRSIIVTIRSVDGRAIILPAKIKRCRHIEGRVHEIGAEFETEINPRDFFVRYDEDSYLFNQECVNPESLEGHVVIATPTSFVRSVITHALERTQIDIECVSTGARALEAVSRRPDLIFAQSMLEDMTGLEFVLAARAEGYSVPIILLHDTKDQDERMVAIGGGANEMLFMPCPEGLILRAAADFLTSRPEVAAGFTINLELESSFVNEVSTAAGFLSEMLQSKNSMQLTKIAQDLRHTAAAYGHRTLLMLCERLIDRLSAQDKFDIVERVAKQVIDACMVIVGRSKSTTESADVGSSRKEAA